MYGSDRTVTTSPSDRGTAGSPDDSRQTFSSNLAALFSMVGVAIGLGNFWRFPYLVGRFGGAAFVLFYVLVVAAVGIPGLMAEWALGRHTRRGTVGAFQRAGLPFGRAIGWFFFAIVVAATAYYCVAVGWVVCFATGEILAALGSSWDPAAILPPPAGFQLSSFLLQVGFTAAVVLAAAIILVGGLRAGIERASRYLLPGLMAVLLVLIVRGLTLPGASAGLHWYAFKFQLRDLTGSVMVAALGQAVFSLALGGTFMVVYGSYLEERSDLRTNAVLTATADTAAGLLAGLAIFPAVFAFGLEPASGPGLIFATLPRVFARIPGGQLFGLLFFTGLAAAALLSAVAAFEVLVAGLTDNTRLPRRPAVAFTCVLVLLVALPPMISLRVFVPWDLTFGSGMQTLGALLAVLTFGWALRRADALRELGTGAARPPVWLYYWLRFVVPAGILLVGIWWLLSDVLHLVGTVG